MKRQIKEILLDFTPLLDVTMIILFFFVLYSRLGVDDVKKQAEQNMQDAAAAQSEAAELHSEAEKMQQEAWKKLAVLEEADGNQAALAAAMEQYAGGDNIKLRLEMKESGWLLRVLRGTELLTALEQSDGAERLVHALEQANYEQGDVLLCEFIYDAEAAGSNQAFRQITEMLETVRESYPHMYISETDLSK